MCLNEKFFQQGSPTKMTFQCCYWVKRCLDFSCILLVIKIATQTRHKQGHVNFTLLTQNLRERAVKYNCLDFKHNHEK